MSSVADLATAAVNSGNYSDVSKQMAGNINAAKTQMQQAMTRADEHQKEAAKAKKDYEKSSNAAAKASDKLSKAKDGPDKDKAQAELDKARSDQGAANAKYRTARGEMKNDAIVLKNLSAQLTDLLKGALPQAAQNQKTGKAGKDAKDAAANQAAEQNKEMTKAFTAQLKDVTKAINDNQRGLQETAPNTVDAHGSEPLHDGEATAKDISQSFSDAEGEGAKANAEFVKDPAADKPRVFGMLDAAKAGTATPAPQEAKAATPKGPANAGLGADSAYQTGGVESRAQSKMSMSSPSTGLSAGSDAHEPPPRAAPADAAAPKAPSLAPVPAPEAQRSSSDAPVSPSGAPASGHFLGAQEAKATSALPSQGPASSDKSGTAGTSPQPTQFSATRGDATDNRQQLSGLEANSKLGTQLAKAPDAQKQSIDLPNGSKATLEFDPAKETLKIGGANGQAGVTVPMTEKQYQGFLKATQDPAVQQSAKNLIGLAKTDPAAFTQAMSAPNLKADFAQASQTGASTSSAPASSSSGSAAGGAKSDEERLKGQFWKTFNDDILDKLMGHKGDGDKSGKSGGGGSKRAAGAAGGPSAVVGGGGGTANTGVQNFTLGLDGSGSAAGADAAGSSSTPAAHNNVLLASDGGGGSGGDAGDSTGGNSGDSSDSQLGKGFGEQYVDKGSDNYTDPSSLGGGLDSQNLTGMELVQAVLLIASQEAQKEVRDMSQQVLAKTREKADLRNQIDGMRNESANMQKADGDGGNQWFSDKGNGAMTATAISINTNMQSMQTKMDGIGDDNQLLFIKLQTLSQQLTQTMQAASNVSKSLFDTSKAIIGNVGH